MTELNPDARSLLERGLAHDGPNAERRERVKQRLLLALASGVVTASAATAVSAGVAAPTVASGVGAGAGVGVGVKGLLTGSLLLWFGAGAAAGVVAAGALALSGQFAPALPTVPLAPPTHAPAEPRLAQRVAQREPTVLENAPFAASSSLTAPALEPRAPLGTKPLATPAVPPASLASTPSSPPSTPDAEPSTLRDEALLLQRAQRALAARAPAKALELLAEHEHRFAAGALAEERRVARILAFCALGRTAEAAALARAFLAASTRSVLVPRLEQSCVAGVVSGSAE